MNSCFSDSNVIRYLLDSNLAKFSKAKMILGLSPIVNSQVLVEVVNVARRKFEYTKDDCVNLWIDLHKYCEIVAKSKNTTMLTIDLVNKYDFQIFDSLIVASALEANCDTLYSEDMQHMLVVENQLTIINPFL